MNYLNRILVIGIIALLAVSPLPIDASVQSTALTAASSQFWLTNTQIGTPTNNKLTIGCWVNLASLPTSGNSYTLAAKTSTDNNTVDFQWFISNVSGSYYVRLKVHTTTGSTGDTEAYGGLTNTSTSHWTFLWSTFDGTAGTNLKIKNYQDSATELTESFTTNQVSVFDNHAIPTALGSRTSGLDYLNGSLSHCRIYNAVIAPSTMLGTESCTDGHSSNSPIAEWPFNGDANDTSGNGYNLTAQNGAGFANSVPSCLQTVASTPPKFWQFLPF